MTKGLEIIKAKRPTTKWTLFKPSFTMVIFTTYLLPTSSFAVDEDDEDGDDDDGGDDDDIDDDGGDDDYEVIFRALPTPPPFPQQLFVFHVSPLMGAPRIEI